MTVLLGILFFFGAPIWGLIKFLSMIFFCHNINKAFDRQMKK